METKTAKMMRESNPEGSPVRATLTIRSATGRLGLDSIPDVWREFVALLQSRPSVLIVNFREVQRLAAGYAAMLVRMKALAESRGTRLVLENIPRQLRAVLRVYKLEDTFEIWDANRTVSGAEPTKGGQP